MAQIKDDLVEKVSSTVSSPTVNYSATYTATRETTSTTLVTIELEFEAWLNSSASKLGTGTKLTIYARMNGGAWSSTVIKTTSASWSGTTPHEADITLTGNVTSNKTKIDFYVTRSGSTYSGSAGNLGSASNPKSYTANLPTYGMTYGVTYSVSGTVPTGYTAPTDSAAYMAGDTVTVKPVPSVDGYSFNGWLLNGSKVTSFTISGNTTLIGVWSQAATDKYVNVKVNGTWKQAIPYVKVNGAWKKAAPYIRVNGTWKST